MLNGAVVLIPDRVFFRSCIFGRRENVYCAASSTSASLSRVRLRTGLIEKDTISPYSRRRRVVVLATDRRRSVFSL